MLCRDYMLCVLPRHSTNPAKSLFLYKLTYLITLFILSFQDFPFQAVLQLVLCRCAECLSLDKFLRYGLISGSSLHDVHTRSEVAVRNLNAVGSIEAYRTSESVNVQTVAAEREVGHYNLLSVANTSCMLAESHLHAILYSER